MERVCVGGRVYDLLRASLLALLLACGGGSGGDDEPDPFDTAADAQYTVQSLVKEPGNVDFIVSGLADFTDLVTASLGFGSDAESASFDSGTGGTYYVALVGKAPEAFTAPATGTVHVAVSGRGGDVSSFSLRAVTTTPVPTGLSTKCSFAVNAGALTVGASPTTGYAPDDHCMLYSFAGTSGTSYTVTLTPLTQQDSPDLVLASNASSSTILDQEATPGGDAIVFTASATQTFHLAVHGFQAAQYTISVAVSPPPPTGLTSHCTSARAGGTLAVGGAHALDSAVAGQCVLFDFPASNGTSYTVTVFTSGGDPSLAVYGSTAGRSRAPRNLQLFRGTCSTPCPHTVHDAELLDSNVQVNGTSGENRC